MPFRAKETTTENFVLSPRARRLPLAGKAGYTAPVRRWLEVARERWVAIALFAVGLALLASAITGDRGMVRISSLRHELESVNDRNFQLLQGINRLRTQLHRIRTDDQAVERLARDRLGFVRDGETLYQLEPQAPAEHARGTSR
jgi:cell division protein FtsB